MVFVEGLKYACEACIKGHRSSSCSHTERPLFEIKKKGRPVTQCEHCRQLRKTKQVHVKCSCGASTEDVPKEVRGKAKRKIPTSAAFPEGLRGASLTSSPTPPKASSSGACSCDTSGGCFCSTPVIKRPSGTSSHGSSDTSSAPVTPPPVSLPSCCGGKNKPGGKAHTPAQSNHSPDNYPDPVVSTPAHAARDPIASTSFNPNNSNAIPILPPPFPWPSSGASITGSCSCGASCACPGCYEHGNPSTLSMFAESCPYACTTCSECNGFGFAPPPPTQDGPTHTQFPTWPELTLPPLKLGLAPASITLSNAPLRAAMSSCCNGACKCPTEVIPCPCTAECCGCCFGCSCSDSDSIGTCTTGGEEEDDMRSRLGFAVSGERVSCRAESKAPKRGRGHGGKDKDKGKGKDTDEGGSVQSKRRRAEESNEERGDVHLSHPLHPVRDLRMLLRSPFELFGARGLDSGDDPRNIVGDGVRRV